MDVKTIRAQRFGVGSERLADPSSQGWASCERHRIDLMPAPIGMVAAVSPYLAPSLGHGKTDGLEARLAHDESTLSIRLSWRDSSKDDRIADLDRFVDGAAVLFPLVPGTNPFVMGESEKPVNAWLWRANWDEPFDVIGRGYATTERRPANESGLVARALHQEGEWRLVFQRPLEVTGNGHVRFRPGQAQEIGFAVWEGSNRERSAQKAVSAGFLSLTLET
jgi:DMSO reductase family type II enzyme heme b subunit